jgi:hypothetical protein
MRVESAARRKSARHQVLLMHVRVSRPGALRRAKDVSASRRPDHVHRHAGAEQEHRPVPFGELRLVFRPAGGA